jgi:hypothetical protein
VQHGTRKKHDLILLRHDLLIAAGTKRLLTFSAWIMETQFSTLEPARFTMKKIYKG